MCLCLIVVFKFIVETQRDVLYIKRWFFMLEDVLRLESSSVAFNLFNC
jgi:hypothetical protein